MNDIEDDDEDQFEDADSWLAEKLEYTQRLKDAILLLHGCEAEYAGRDDVFEDVTGPLPDDLYWSGYVEIFRLDGHPKAKRCYAWSQFTGITDDDERYVAILELPPVDSPHAAVRAAITAEMKNAEEEIIKTQSMKQSPRPNLEFPSKSQLFVWQHRKVQSSKYKAQSTEF